jgi:hypothetical protein
MTRMGRFAITSFEFIKEQSSNIGKTTGIAGRYFTEKNRKESGKTKEQWRHRSNWPSQERPVGGKGEQMILPSKEEKFPVTKHCNLLDLTDISSATLQRRLALRRWNLCGRSTRSIWNIRSTEAGRFATDCGPKAIKWVMTGCAV